MRKRLFLLIGTMVGLIFVFTVLIYGINSFRSTKGFDETSDGKEIEVVASFYPTYILTLNLTEGIPGLHVTNLTNYSSGCLHDYQITTENMKSLSDAEVLVINGGGMENFIESALNSYPNLAIIEASRGIPLLEEDSDDQVDSQIDKHSNEQIDEQNEEQDRHAHEANAHVWLDPRLYIEQIDNVRDGLIEYIRARSDFSDSELQEIIEGIESNATEYIEAVTELDNEYQELLHPDKDQNNNDNGVVIFHDAFAYLANRIGLKVAYTVELDADTYLSTAEIAEIIDMVKADNIRYLFTELQYSDSIARRIEEETDALVYIIDSAVTGDGSVDSYLNSMRDNLVVLKEALK